MNKITKKEGKKSLIDELIFSQTSPKVFLNIPRRLAPLKILKTQPFIPRVEITIKWAKISEIVNWAAVGRLTQPTGRLSSVFLQCRFHLCDWQVDSTFRQVEFCFPVQNSSFRTFSILPQFIPLKLLFAHFLSKCLQTRNNA